MVTSVAGSINGDFFPSSPETVEDLAAGVQAPVTTADASLLLRVWEIALKLIEAQRAPIVATLQTLKILIIDNLRHLTVKYILNISCHRTYVIHYFRPFFK